VTCETPLFQHGGGGEGGYMEARAGPIMVKPASPDRDAKKVNLPRQ